MKYLLSFVLFCFVTSATFCSAPPAKPIRILVITGGHDYKEEQFNQMLASLGENITYQISGISCCI